LVKIYLSKCIYLLICCRDLFAERFLQKLYFLILSEHFSAIAQAHSQLFMSKITNLNSNPILLDIHKFQAEIFTAFFTCGPCWSGKDGLRLDSQWKGGDLHFPRLSLHQHNPHSNHHWNNQLIMHCETSSINLINAGSKSAITNSTTPH